MSQIYKRYAARICANLRNLRTILFPEVSRFVGRSRAERLTLFVWETAIGQRSMLRRPFCRGVPAARALIAPAPPPGGCAEGRNHSA
jgi:hypothetical protein